MRRHPAGLTSEQSVSKDALLLLLQTANVDFPKRFHGLSGITAVVGDGQDIQYALDCHEIWTWTPVLF